MNGLIMSRLYLFTDNFQIAFGESIQKFNFAMAIKVLLHLSFIELFYIHENSVIYLFHHQRSFCLFIKDK